MQLFWALLLCLPFAIHGYAFILRKPQMIASLADAHTNAALPHLDSNRETFPTTTKQRDERTSLRRNLRRSIVFTNVSEPNSNTDPVTGTAIRTNIILQPRTNNTGEIIGGAAGGGVAAAGAAACCARVFG